MYIDSKIHAYAYIHIYASVHMGQRVGKNSFLTRKDIIINPKMLV